MSMIRSGAVIAALSASALHAEPMAQAPICPDRPSKANGTCTVPAGKWQIETSLADWTRDRSGGTTTDIVLWGNSLLKYGLTDRADIELGFTPYQTLRVRAGGESEHASGFGDMMVRAKQRITADGAPMQATLVPFIKLPTAKPSLGNRKIEGGIIVPVSYSIAGTPLTLTAGPEIDWRADADGHGHHAAMAQLINLGLAASPRLSFSAELWGQWDWDPAGTGRQVSADASAAYLLGNSVQLDAAANFGLNRQTPDVEVYAGISKLFR